MYRSVIENEMRRRDQGMKPPPERVMDKLLEKMEVSINSKSDQTRFEKLTHTFECQTEVVHVSAKPSSPHTSMKKIDRVVLTPFDKLLFDLREQPKCNFHISDWKRVPVHKVVMNNMNEIQALKSCVADLSIFQFLGRLEDPQCNLDEAL